MVETNDEVGVLLSGGLDSSILLATLMARGRRVQPFYLRTDVVWAKEELAAVRQFLAAIDTPRLQGLVIFDLPLADLYGDHWSISGRGTPGEDTPDEAVFLPGRNGLLAIKPLVWCQANHIAELALAVLAGNPFADATPDFCESFAAAMNAGSAGKVSITRPFADLSKDDVLRLGRDLPLEHTFSCISPHEGLHCGRCNKCAERQAAFRRVTMDDPTTYASASRFPLSSKY